MVTSTVTAHAVPVPMNAAANTSACAILILMRASLEPLKYKRGADDVPIAALSMEVDAGRPFGVTGATFRFYGLAMAAREARPL
jgi:hypothetical protein